MDAEWDFAKLPQDEHAVIIAAYAENDARKLLEIHDKYQLSPHKYCCIDGLLAWYKWAIDNGIIHG